MLSAQKTSDPVWQLPLHQLYKEGLNSEIADMANSAPTGLGGAITDTLYIENIVEDIPWIHFDLMAWKLQARTGKPIGGEAMGIRAVLEYLQRRYAEALGAWGLELGAWSQEPRAESREPRAENREPRA